MTTGRSFEALDEEDKTVAKSLAAFCASTKGAYGLYLAQLACERVTYRDYEDDDDAFSSDDEGADITMRLESPWLPYLQSDTFTGSTIDLDLDDLIAPDELWTELKEVEWEIEHKGFHIASEKTQSHTAYALVVQAKPESAKGKKRKA